MTAVQRDSALGWLLTALLALQIAIALAAGPARADTAGNNNGGESFSGWQLRLASLEAIPARAVARPAASPVRAGPDVFGSVAVSMSKLAVSDRWNELLAERPAGLFEDNCTGSLCGTAALAGWRATHRQASRMSGIDRIAFVNRKVNALVRYTSDAALYGRGDHWAGLAETVKTGAGDCEDIAIAKMWILNALGVPLGDMQVVVLKDRRRGLDHAVLAVATRGGALILDNVHDRVLEDTRIPHYRPVYSVSAAGSWVHGFRNAPARLSALETRN